MSNLFNAVGVLLKKAAKLKQQILRDSKNQVYTLEKGTLVKLGQLVVNEKGEQVLQQSNEEPADKKERRKQRAGLPYRSKR